jgi:DNA-binding transcriptional MerR regulator
LKIQEEKLTKLYYSIGEVAEMFHVNTSLIRFWEKEFEAVKPKKNKKGNRLFSPKDITNLGKIYDLVKIQGFTLDGAKKSLKIKTDSTVQVPTSSNELVIEKLETIRVKLLNMKKG